MIKKALQKKVGKLTKAMYDAKGAGDERAEIKAYNDRNRVASWLIWWSSARERWPVRTAKWIITASVNIFSLVLAVMMLAIAYPWMWIVALKKWAIGTKEAPNNELGEILVRLAHVRTELIMADGDPLKMHDLSEEYSDLTKKMESLTSNK